MISICAFALLVLLLINVLDRDIGGRHTDATVTAATAAAARPIRGAGGVNAMRRSGSLMDFSGKGLVLLCFLLFLICS